MYHKIKRNFVDISHSLDFFIVKFIKNNAASSTVLKCIRLDTINNNDEDDDVYNRLF